MCMRSDDGLTVISRVVKVLQVFRDRPGALNASEVSRRASIPHSTCHRILTTLAEEGMLEKDSDARYHVGLALWQVAASSPRAVRIQRVALPYMRDLYEITRYPVHLAIRDGNNVVFVERLAPSGDELERPQVGSSYPLHVTAVGLVLLAFSSPEVQDQYLRLPLRRVTQFTMTDPGELRSVLAEVRATGLAISDRQVNRDALSVAAPIRGASDHVEAAISANVTPHRKNEASLAHAVQAVALSVTRSLEVTTGDQMSLLPSRRFKERFPAE